VVWAIELGSLVGYQGLLGINRGEKEFEIFKIHPANYSNNGRISYYRR